MRATVWTERNLRGGMQIGLQRILELQHSWNWKKTEEMKERGKLVRNEVSDWLRSLDAVLSSAIDIPVSDFLAEAATRER
jgi:hypothetical protein